MVDHNSDYKEKRNLSEIGIKYGIFFLIVTILQILLAGLASLKKEYFSGENQLILAFVIVILSTYVIGYPILCILLRKTPKENIKETHLGISRFIKGLFCMFGILLIGVIIGQVFNKSINSLLNISSTSSNIMERIDTINPIYSAITVGILGPIFEELIFRKKLIDCTIKYGENVAILASGIMFGLFHASVTQFFYATGLGMLWAYVYIKTGRIRYSIIYHMINNLTVSVLMVEIVKQLDILEDSNMSMATAFCLFFLIVIGCLLFIGILYVIKNMKRFWGIMKMYNVKNAAKILIKSRGMWFYYILCVLMILEGYVK